MAAMTRNEARAVVADRLGNRTDLNDEIDLALRMAQVELEQGPFYPWFLLTTDSTLVTAASPGFDQLVMPTDFIKEYEETDLEWWDSTNSKWVMLERDDANTLRRADLSAYDTPSFYAPIGTTAFLLPAPTATLTFRLTYYAAAAELTSDITNGWLTNAPEVLISKAGLKIAPFVENSAAVAAFGQSLALALRALEQADLAKRAANERPVMRYLG